MTESQQSKKKKQEQRKCNTCDELKNIKLFAFDTRCSKGRKRQCKDCHTKYQHDWYLKNKLRCKNVMLRWRLGNNIPSYEILFKTQNGKCAICGHKQRVLRINNKIRSLAVDHDHKTGKVRGLLCMDCNRALGMFKESIINLKKAVIYLQKYEK